MKTKWAVKQTFKSSGKVTTVGPYQVDGDATDQVVIGKRIDVYVDVFNTKRGAEIFLENIGAK